MSQREILSLCLRLSFLERYLGAFNRLTTCTLFYLKQPKAAFYRLDRVQPQLSDGIGHRVSESRRTYLGATKVTCNTLKVKRKMSGNIISSNS